MIARPFPGLDPRQVIGPVLRPLSRLPAGAILTHLGRTALAQAYRALRLGPGDEVLVPALHCGVEVEAARFAGATVRFYRVNRSLDLDPADLASRIADATRAVVVTHFFGFPQDLGAIAALCRAKGIALIEDCAHVFPSAPRGANSPGARGMAAVYSLPKFFPVPDGGLLVLHDEWPAQVSVPRLGGPPRVPLARRTARLLLDRVDEGRPGVAALLDRALVEPLRGVARLGGGARPGGSDPPTTRARAASIPALPKRARRR